MSQIILASASPRRKELLEQIGAEFVVCPAKGEEIITEEEPSAVVMELSRQKAEEVASGVLTYNEQHAELVRMLPLAVISGLAGFLAAILPQKGKTVQKFGIAVILGGAVSNLYDRMIRHYVVDYFSIQCGKLKKVVFNLGDIFVFLGSGILFGAEIVKEIRGMLPEKTPVDSSRETM